MTPFIPRRLGSWHLLAVLLLLTLLIGGTASATTRIVPIGDSLTHGGGDSDDGDVHPTYRYWLWKKLDDAGYDVDFVGSSTSPTFSGYSFDRGNEGHGGFTIGGIVDGVGSSGKLSSWLKGYNPDIALVLIGTNDVLWNVPMEKRFSNLGRLVDTLRARNPEMVIFIGKLPPTGDAQRNKHQGLLEFNSRLPGWAAGESTSRSPIRVVDLFSGYDGRDDNQADRYIHPDESGEKKIANRFFSAIASYLDKGDVPDETKTPTVTPTPTETSTPTATPTPSETPTPTGTPTPSPTVTPMPTETPTPTETATPTTTMTHAPSPSLEPTPVVTASPTPTIVVVTSAPTQVFPVGKRYVIGDPGKYLGTRFGSTGSATVADGSRTAVTIEPTLKPGSRAYGLKPPEGRFIRWYPAVRWAAGIR